MESSTHTHRALTAGLSIGAGIAVSAAAFAATIPFDDIHATVTTALVPFAVGSLAGVGIHAIATAIDDHVAASDRRGAKQARAEKRRMSENRVADGLFSTARQATPKGVPVIARAQDALSEAEAWAEIDSLLSSDSPVSCDPLKSKDIYEIALEEMARGTAQTAQTAQAQATPSADQTAQTHAVQSEPAARTAQVAQAAPAWSGVTVGPEETATYMRIQAVARAQAQAQAQPAVAPGVPAASAVPVVPVTPAAQVASAAPAATPQPASAVPASQVPAITVDVQQPAPASPAFRMAGIDDTNVLVALAAASAAARAATDTLMSAQAAEAKAVPASVTASVAEPASQPEVEVPMVDYSGHEDMWAKALAILAEEDSAREVASPVQPVAASQESQLLDEDDGPIAKIFDGLDKIPWSEDYDTVLEDTDAVGRARMSAIAEGARDTGVHTRVNEIIDEEFNRVPSQSVRTTSREYLRVIQGGTVAMPRYTAEA